MHPSREEVEQAFRNYWRVGALEERWDEWAPAVFTEDVLYVERIYGTLHGRDAVHAWITKLMVDNRDIHALMDWYMIEGDRVVVSMINRYYNPEPGGAPFDFPGITILRYAGEGRFNYEEDYWDLRLAKRAWKDFNAALARHGRAAIEETPERMAARDPWR